MSETSRPMIDEVDLMIDNARLRDELEPYRDDSIGEPAIGRMPLQIENEYLSSILAWERAPALPIRDWCNPPLRIPPSETLSDDRLSAILKQTIDCLHSQGIVLTCTDHLSDRELYRVIDRDILPCCEKKLNAAGHRVEYRCVDDTETWLTFYADAVERRRFQEEHHVELPKARKPRYPRELP